MYNLLIDSTAYEYMEQNRKDRHLTSDLSQVAGYKELKFNILYVLISTPGTVCTLFQEVL